MIGPPGSGKGTQAERLIARCGYVYVGVGDQLRSEMSHHSRLGRVIEHYVATGALVPTPIVHEEVAAILRKQRPRIARSGGILDGYPRTLSQAKDLLSLLKEVRLRNPLIVVNLRGPDRLFAGRLLGRGRADDTPAVARRRLRQFRKEVAPILAFLRRHTSVLDVASTGSVPVVARSVRQAIDRRLRELQAAEGGSEVDRAG